MFRNSWIFVLFWFEIRIVLERKTWARLNVGPFPVGLHTIWQPKIDNADKLWKITSNCVGKKLISLEIDEFSDSSTLVHCFKVIQNDDIPGIYATKWRPWWYPAKLERVAFITIRGYSDGCAFRSFVHTSERTSGFASNSIWSSGLCKILMQSHFESTLSGNLYIGCIWT